MPDYNKLLADAAAAYQPNYTEAEDKEPINNVAFMFEIEGFCRGYVRVSSGITFLVPLEVHAFDEEYRNWEWLNIHPELPPETDDGLEFSHFFDPDQFIRVCFGVLITRAKIKCEKVSAGFLWYKSRMETIKGPLPLPYSFDVYWNEREKVGSEGLSERFTVPGTFVVNVTDPSDIASGKARADIRTVTITPLPVEDILI